MFCMAAPEPPHELGTNAALVEPNGQAVHPYSRMGDILEYPVRHRKLFALSARFLSRCGTGRYRDVR